MVRRRVMSFFDQSAVRLLLSGRSVGRLVCFSSCWLRSDRRSVQYPPVEVLLCQYCCSVRRIVCRSKCRTSAMYWTIGRSIRSSVRHPSANTLLAPRFCRLVCAAVVDESAIRSALSFDASCSPSVKMSYARQYETIRRPVGRSIGRSVGRSAGHLACYSSANTLFDW